MSTGFNPSYSVFRVPLTSAADTSPRSELIGYIKVIRFETVAGVPILDGEIRFSLGTAVDEYIPLLYNNEILFPQKVARWRLDWEIQADTVAVIAVSLEPDVLRLDTPNPKQLVSSAVGVSYTASNLVVGTTEVSATPSDDARQSVIFQNLGPGKVEIINSGNAFGTGIQIDIGDVFTLDDTSAEIFLISNMAGTNVRMLIQGS